MVIDGQYGGIMIVIIMVNNICSLGIMADKGQSSDSKNAAWLVIVHHE